MLLFSLLSCRGLQPLDLQQLRFAKRDLYFVLVNPKFEAPTAEMRAVLPKMVPMTAAIHNSSMGGSLVSSLKAEALTETLLGLQALSGATIQIFDRRQTAMFCWKEPICSCCCSATYSRHKHRRHSCLTHITHVIDSFLSSCTALLHDTTFWTLCPFLTASCIGCKGLLCNLCIACPA